MRVDVLLSVVCGVLSAAANLSLAGGYLLSLDGPRHYEDSVILSYFDTATFEWSRVAVLPGTSGEGVIGCSLANIRGQLLAYTEWDDARDATRLRLVEINGKIRVRDVELPRIEVVAAWFRRTPGPGDSLAFWTYDSHNPKHTSYRGIDVASGRMSELIEGDVTPSQDDGSPPMRPPDHIYLRFDPSRDATSVRASAPAISATLQPPPPRELYAGDISATWHFLGSGTL